MNGMGKYGRVLKVLRGRWGVKKGKKKKKGKIENVLEMNQEECKIRVRHDNKKL
jgi:hypothetical protein